MGVQCFLKILLWLRWREVWRAHQVGRQNVLSWKGNAFLTVLVTLLFSGC